MEEALKLKNNKKRTSEDNFVFVNFDDVHSTPIVITRSPPFYLSLRLEGWVNNGMIDTRASSTIIPKFVVDEMKLYITRCIDGVIQLDSSPFDVISSFKGVNITLNAFFDIFFIQDIIVVDLPPLFGICLSREFIANLGCYLALDYTHLLIPLKIKYVKVPNEGTKKIHLTKITKKNYMNEYEQVDTFDRDPIMESLLTIKILSANDLNYQVIDVGMGNYYLHENVQPILVIVEKEYEVWTIYFDGTRCKHGCGASVVLKSLYGHMKRFSFRFTWTCTNNVVEY